MEENLKIAKFLFKQNKYQETIDTCKQILDIDTNSINALKLALENGESVVLDATHPSIEKRQAFVNIAKEFKIPVRLVHITTSFDESKSRNANRETKLPPIVLYVYRKKYEEPSINEGFTEIIKI